MTILGSKTWKMENIATQEKRAKSRQNMAILGIKTWKMENIAENDRKEGIRTRQGFGELIRKEGSRVIIISRIMNN